MWQRCLYERISAQCGVVSALVLAEKLLNTAEQTGSTIYCLFSFNRPRQYVDMVECRLRDLRALEHVSSIRQHARGTEAITEKKKQIYVVRTVVFFATDPNCAPVTGTLTEKGGRYYSQ